MTVYLVRLKKGRQIVGFFAARGRANLLDMIDEVTDPTDCECCVVPNFGLLWEGPAYKVPAARLPARPLRGANLAAETEQFLELAGPWRPVIKAGHRYMSHTGESPALDLAHVAKVISGRVP